MDRKMRRIVIGVIYASALVGVVATAATIFAQAINLFSFEIPSMYSDWLQEHLAKILIIGSCLSFLGAAFFVAAVFLKQNFVMKILCGIISGLLISGITALIIVFFSLMPREDLGLSPGNYYLMIDAITLLIPQVIGFMFLCSSYFLLPLTQKKRHVECDNKSKE